MIFGISGTKRTIRNRRCPYYSGVRKERLDCRAILVWPWKMVSVRVRQLFLSANGWQDQNMDSSFSRQRKPSYEEDIVRLTNRVAVWRQSEVSIDF